MTDGWTICGGLCGALVSYAAGPQPVTIEFGQPVRGTILSPDGPAEAVVEGLSMEIELDVYAVLDYKECKE